MTRIIDIPNDRWTAGTELSNSAVACLASRPHCRAEARR